ncbi:UNVERIFIED_ORG: putative amidohydrolase [Idiomarina abyssalis]|uniref:carbon-nitrogen hydrolase family protein n=2 Tax=Idiomarina TaxID=135575 RepID=UPI000D830F55|nr:MULTISPECIES: carbon-nitrogen hydrolase family protein [Idiomarina]PWW37534.1 putative amidohydrolase [Idiomarina loihiensis]TDO48801.1 putative amidohydrolase [Idiomarina sp. 017G]TDP47559.1 putative amidohydrolase [Idiomarina loihiensis]TDS23300.1 putative amidohydrolase [Idiomarina sp. H2]
MTQVQLTALQMSSRPDPQDNLAIVAKLLEQLPAARPQLVVLPEAFSCFGAGDRAQLAMAEPYKDGEVQKQLAALAKKHEVYLVGGTLPVDAGERFSAASILFGPDGAILNRYDKIHLFDVDVADNTKEYRESKWTQPGSNVVTTETDFGVVGMAVCYDLRFPELFRALRQAGSQIIVLPSAFTQVTGKAHWHALVRARAIEQQVFIVAPGQVGEHANGRETFGHSIIVSPWGEILAEQELDEGVVSVSVDVADIESIRKQMPVAQQNQFEVVQKT